MVVRLKTIWRNNGQYFPIFDENYKHIYPELPTDLKPWDMQRSSHKSTNRQQITKAAREKEEKR